MRRRFAWMTVAGPGGTARTLMAMLQDPETTSSHLLRGLAPVGGPREGA